MRLVTLVFISTVLLLATGCGDDDSTPTPTEAGETTAAATETPTEEPAGTTTDRPTQQPTPEPTPSPTRRDVAYDYYAAILAFPNLLIEGLGYTPENVDCPYDAVDAVVDCTAQGYGRIAIDVEPIGVVEECHAFVSPEDVPVGAGCTTADPSGWTYRIIE